METYNDNDPTPAKQPKEARDCYQMARQWQTTPEEAAERMRQGWHFWGYDATHGTSLFVPPEK